MEEDRLGPEIRAGINRLLFFERKRSFELDGIRLHPSEIHVMLETRGEKAVSVTKIAGRLGITKGAVSQTLSRLEKKGILVRTRDPVNKNELSAQLTPLGKRAFGEYREIQLRLDGAIRDLAARYSPGEQQAVVRFLGELGRALEEI